jgi:predicted esterase
LRRCSPARGALLFFLAAAACAEDFAAGRVTEKVVCRGDPAQAYALYLPPAYAADKHWPILYLLDARGRALVPIERFREAAATYGWILASSYNSRSDTKDDPNTPALQAMWRDTRALLAIDERRVYLSGFSGGARASVAIALAAPQAIAGVIGCGAGLHDDRVSLERLPFRYFGTVGDRDFNYYEMRELAARLAAAKAPGRVDVFAGGHDWPPSDLAADAIAWMETEAMKSGTRSRDDALVASLHALDLARAGALAAEGKESEAYLRYARVAEDYRGLADVEAEQAKAASLGRSRAVRKALEDAKDRDEADRATIRAIARKLNAALASPEPVASGAIAAQLGIAALRRKAASGSPEERLSAERILANLRVQSSFYLPEELTAKKDYAHARLSLEVAAAIDPDDPLVYYNLACAAARAGQVGRTLADLQDAVDRGFRRFAMIDGDPDFSAVRADPKFRAWLEKARAGAEAPTPSAP